MDAILNAQNLKAAYDGRTIFEAVNLQVSRGEVFVILGGSGCGKSTLMKLLIGLEAPAEGQVKLFGEDIHAAWGASRQKILNRIGVMYQSGALFGSITLAENVLLPLDEFTDLPHAAKARIAALKLALVGLSGFEGHKPSEISGGMKKRAAIARAMALDPEILFLDEPSAGLDPVTAAELDQVILRLARGLGITFVIVTHELASIFAIADRVIMLDKNAKTVIAEGTPKQLQTSSRDERVLNFFNRKAETAERSGPR